MDAGPVEPAQDDSGQLASPVAPAIHRVTVRGLRVHWYDGGEEPVTATLRFRVGPVDETVASAGLTAMAANTLVAEAIDALGLRPPMEGVPSAGADGDLGLGHSPEPDDWEDEEASGAEDATKAGIYPALGWALDGTSVAFYCTGTAAEVGERLACLVVPDAPWTTVAPGSGAARWFQAGIERTTIEELLAPWFGARGYGLGYALGRFAGAEPTPAGLHAWARSRFVRENAVLVLNRDPDQVDLPDLPAGRSYPPPPPQPIATVPTFIPIGDGVLAWSGIAPRVPALSTAVHAVADRLRRQVEGPHRLVFEVEVSILPLDASSALVVIAVEGADLDAAVLLAPDLEAILDDLSAEGPTPTELTRDRSRRQSLALDRPGLAHQLAENDLAGATPVTFDELIGAWGAIVAHDVKAALAATRSRSLLLAPLPEVPAGYEPYPDAQRRRSAGIFRKSIRDGKHSRLLVDDEGVAEERDGEIAWSVDWLDVELAHSAPHRLRLVTRDWGEIELAAGDWEYGAQLLAVVARAIPRSGSRSLSRIRPCRRWLGGRGGGGRDRHPEVERSRPATSSNLAHDCPGHRDQEGRRERDRRRLESLASLEGDRRSEEQADHYEGEHADHRTGDDVPAQPFPSRPALAVEPAGVSRQPGHDAKEEGGRDEREPGEDGNHRRHRRRRGHDGDEQRGDGSTHAQPAERLPLHVDNGGAPDVDGGMRAPLGLHGERLRIAVASAGREEDRRVPPRDGMAVVLCRCLKVRGLRLAPPALDDGGVAAQRLRLGWQPWVEVGRCLANRLGVALVHRRNRCADPGLPITSGPGEPSLRHGRRVPAEEGRLEPRCHRQRLRILRPRGPQPPREVHRGPGPSAVPGGERVRDADAGSGPALAQPGLEQRDGVLAPRRREQAERLGVPQPMVVPLTRCGLGSLPRNCRIRLQALADKRAKRLVPAPRFEGLRILALRRVAGPATEDDLDLVPSRRAGDQDPVAALARDVPYGLD